jgi:hypothetical protein
MPSSNVTLSSDITTTDWTTTGSNFHSVLAANSGAGDGSHFVNQPTGGGGTNNLVGGCTFNTSGITAVTGCTYTLAWENDAKTGSANFLIKVYSSGGGTLLASMSSPVTTSSSSEITSGPTSLTLNDGTATDWTNFEVVLETAISGDNSGNFFGLIITPTYTTGSPPGAPTAIAASNAGPTSVGLTWAQGSGTVTDNPIQYMAANAGSWTNVDPGSAVTSYTISGLTYGQLYFFQVAAENTNGTSAYDGPIPWVCGSTWTGQVAQASDDAIQNTSTGAVTIGDSSDALGNSTIAGFRFESVGIAQGAAILAAYPYFYAAPSPSGTYPVDCQLATNASTFTAATNNISSRTLTGNSATMNAGAFGSGWNQGPNINAAAQAVFAQGGWSSGNALAVIVGQGGSPNLTVEMWDGNPTEAAVIAIFLALPPAAQFVTPRGCAAMTAPY